MTKKPQNPDAGTPKSEVGYGRPPKHTQFGQPGAPAQGKTSAQRKMEIANAEKATLIRGRLLDAVIDASDAGGSGKTMELIEAAMLKLLADSENRGLGTPKQTVDNTSSDGTMSPKQSSDAVLSALARKHADP